MRCIIAGGGIGGLVAALCLHKNGHDVTVYESAKSIKPLGVGINLLPHAVRVLDYLDLLPDLDKIAIRTSDLLYTNRFGQAFLNDKRGTFAGYKWPQFSIHRGLFQQMLYEKTVATLGAEKVITGHHIDHFSEDEHKITATFVDPDTQEVIHQAGGDLLIGADGIHSATRKQCFPKEGKVVYSGNILYRGTALIKPFHNGSTMAMIGSNKQKMVVYPIGHINPDTGLQLINWVANLKEPKGQQLTIRDWNRKVDRGFLLEHYKDWHFDWLDVRELIEKAPAIYEFPMSDRNPLDQWTFGRFTLMGDAAHPMYPIGSNGASQAILDAAALSLALNQSNKPQLALKKYEEERRPATSKIVLQNRKKGPDAILDVMEERFPEGFKPQEIPHEEIESVMQQYKQIAGFDRDSLNAKTKEL